MRILVTGGAGYIGSHAARRLLEEGRRVLIVDNLSRGHLSAVEAVRSLPVAAGGRLEFVVMDVRSRTELTALLRGWKPDAAMHFAAMAYVEESTRMPLEYHSANTGGTISLLHACRDAGVDRVILSSTCTYYGEPGPDRLPITEECETTPIHPYGWSKRMAERVMFDYAAWCVDQGRPFACGALRYFNVAGCDAKGLLGEDHRPETHLVPICIEAALGIRPYVEIRGDDYDTPDGSCLRDYVHVDDLVDAHVKLLDALNPGEARAYNLGIGKPFSVKDVVDSVRRVSGREIETRIGPRRPGDAAALWASGDRARAELRWSPRFAELDAIVQTAWKWRLARPNGYAS